MKTFKDQYYEIKRKHTKQMGNLRITEMDAFEKVKKQKAALRPASARNAYDEIASKIQKVKQ